MLKNYLYVLQIVFLTNVYKCLIVFCMLVQRTCLTIKYKIWHIYNFQLAYMNNCNDALIQIDYFCRVYKFQQFAK